MDNRLDADLQTMQKVKKPAGRPLQYLTITQVAKLKGCNRSAVHLAITTGRLAAAKLGEGEGTIWIIPKAEAEAWTPAGPGPRKKANGAGRESDDRAE